MNKFFKINLLVFIWNYHGFSELVSQYFILSIIYIKRQIIFESICFNISFEITSKHHKGTNDEWNSIENQLKVKVYFLFKQIISILSKGK